jgi:hypothetical protein
MSKCFSERRKQKIVEREARLEVARREYLEERTRQKERIAKDKAEKETRKQTWLREKAAERAVSLRDKHAEVEKWERLEDVRTQNNVKKEHERNMLMLDHIEGLRAQFAKEEAERDQRKRDAVKERREQEEKSAEEKEKANQALKAVEETRASNIAERQKLRASKNQGYCEKIRDQKTAESMKLQEHRAQVELARDAKRQERKQEREEQATQDEAAARIKAIREENIRKKQKERDLKFASKVQDTKDQGKQRQLEIETKKIQRRLQEKEHAEKRHTEEQEKKKHTAELEEQREHMIQERVIERNKREQQRAAALAADANGNAGKAPTGGDGGNNDAPAPGLATKEAAPEPTPA